MLKKWSLRILAGLIVFIIALLINAPARLLENQLTSSVPGLVMNGTRGTLFSGQSESIAYDGKSLSRLSWNISASALLTGNLATELSADDPLFKGNLFLEKGLSDGLTVSAVSGQTSIAELVRLWPSLALFKPAGNLLWNDTGLTVTSQSFADAEGDMSWNNATLSVNGSLLQLGRIHFKPVIEGDELLINLSSDSVLDLKGVLRISRDHRYLLEASLTDNLPDNIRNPIKMMARNRMDEAGNGRLVLKIPGRW